ncbi:MAG: PVC-type heme-binding CxxCH protein [Verrucomicrobiota bacterium]
MERLTKFLPLLLFLAHSAGAQIESLKVPAGFVIERVAAPPLLDRPMLASFDDRGRLYVADSSGTNLPGAELLKNPPHCIRRLEDTNGDGIFDQTTIFADKMVFPQGVVWHNGAVYVSSPPNFWRLQDTNDDGVADTREILASGFALSGISDDMHGGSLGPDGRIYWFAGRLPHEIKNRDGKLLHKGRWPLMLRCRPDGSDLEMVSGVHGNCVGAAFTPEGEPFACGTFYGTMGVGSRDAIIHCVDGAEYPVLDLGISNEHKHTGELMPALTHFGVAAASGLTRYRGENFGAEFQGNLFSALFNMHKVMRHVLERDGATFKSRDEDFLTSTSPDFHPTDVLEDADGSLLVVDTGGWFRIGCPTSQIAKPDVKGGIYRIRRKDAPYIADARGLKIKWKSLPPPALAPLLGDSRFAVREHAIQQLANLGKNSVEILKDILAKENWGARASRVSRSASRRTESETEDREVRAATPRTARETRALPVEARRNAIWALTRIDSDEARAAARHGLDDQDSSVRQTAARSVGLWRDTNATPRLMELVRREIPPVRREAATALGRIRRAEAAPALLEGLRGGGDRFLQHTLIFALIEINDRAATLPGLADSDSAVRRGALIALDQMDDGNLKPEMVMPFLDPADPSMQQTALWVIANHPDWAKPMLGFFEEWLKNFDEKKSDALKRQLLGFSKDPAIQEFIAQHLHDKKTPSAARLVLLETMAQAPLDKLPASWAAELESHLTNSDAQVVRQAVATIRSVPSDKKPALRRIDAQIDFAFTNKNFAGTKLSKNFFVRWTGILKISIDGDYKFATESNDGSRLFVDGKQIVDNGGLHEKRLVESSTELKTGGHEIRIEFFQSGGEAGCKVFWNPPASGKEILPAAVLFHRKSAGLGSPNDPEPGLVGEYFDTGGQAPGFLELNAVKFDAPLLQIAADVSQSADLRVEALAAAAPQLIELNEPLFEFLLASLEKEKSPLVRMTASSALGLIPLDDSQLVALSRVLPSVGSLEISRLLTAFARNSETNVGENLLSALEKSPALESIRADSLSEVLKNYPLEIQQNAAPLLQKLSVNLEKQKARLAELRPVLQGGNALRGRELFFNKATCFACHTVQGVGGHVGPDLSKIGAIRAAPDLLEAILFPSASFARGFEPFSIITQDDEVHSGIISRETADAIYFYDGTRIETRFPRPAIKAIRPGTVSIMPEGLDAQLSRQELSDLIAFLLSLH